MTPVSTLLRKARRTAGLTQAEMAERLATTQSAVARLERPGANPTVAMLDRALAAAGHRLELRARPVEPNVDETLIAMQLRLTPEQRLRAFESAYSDARELARAGARARGELA